MRVRRANPADIPAMVELGRDIPTSANWSHVHYEGFFRTAAPELSRYFVLVVEDPSWSKSVTESTPTSPIIAHLIAHQVGGDWELQYMAVAKESRRRGVGTYLLNEFISYVRVTHSRQIFLEVRESNQGARRLYKTLGFEETGLRRSYYASPPEDAILYRLNLH